MYCVNCGNELNDLAVICPKCGHAVNVGNKTKKPVNTAKATLILNYVSVILLCLSLTLLICSIFFCWIHTDGSVYYNDIYVYSYFWLDSGFTFTSTVFSSLAFINSTIGFVFGFREENKDKKFRCNVLFIISIFMLFSAIMSNCYNF